MNKITQKMIEKGNLFCDEPRINASLKYCIEDEIYTKVRIWHEYSLKYNKQENCDHLEPLRLGREPSIRS